MLTHSAYCLADSSGNTYHIGMLEDNVYVTLRGFHTAQQLVQPLNVIAYTLNVILLTYPNVISGVDISSRVN